MHLRLILGHQDSLQLRLQERLNAMVFLDTMQEIIELSRDAFAFVCFCFGDDSHRRDARHSHPCEDRRDAEAPCWQANCTQKPRNEDHTTQRSPSGLCARGHRTLRVADPTSALTRNCSQPRSLPGESINAWARSDLSASKDETALASNASALASLGLQSWELSHLSLQSKQGTFSILGLRGWCR